MYQLNLFPQNGKILLASRLVYTMKYTVKDLRVDFPTEEACLKWLVEYLYPTGITCPTCEKVTKHYPIKGRKVYSCSACGHHVSPTATTIFHNSRTPLTDWFHAIYLMATNKAGTSAKEVERELGVTYKTAWRMMHQIRSMMNAPDTVLEGEVEIDETSLHPNPQKRSTAKKAKSGTSGIILGMVQRNGLAKTWVIPTIGASAIHPLIKRNVAFETLVFTDGYFAYRRLPEFGFYHHWTDHGHGQYVDGENHTQNIDNIWSNLKRGLHGIYRHVGNNHLQAYSDEYAWRYSNRKKGSMFWALMMRVDK